MAGPFVQGGPGASGQAVIQIAPQFDYARAVAFGGGLLVVTSFFGRGGFAIVRSALNLPGEHVEGAILSPSYWYTPFVEVLGIALLYGIARTGRAGGSLALTVIVALWVLWLIQNYSALASHSGGILEPLGSPAKRAAAGGVAGLNQAAAAQQQQQNKTLY